MCHYLSFYTNDGHFYVECFPVERDDEYIDKILFQATEFYRCMTEMIEPPKMKGDNDEPIEIDSPDFHDLAVNWKAAAEMKAFYTEKEKCYKEELIRVSEGRNCHGYGVSLKNIDKVGNINWKSVWEKVQAEYPMVKIDPETFRGEETSYWKISQDKK